MVERPDPLSIALPVLVLAAGLLILSGLRYSSRQPSPYLGRVAELLEIAVVLALVPMACWVLGLYGMMRGLGG
jgi:hypothetical protein